MFKNIYFEEHLLRTVASVLLGREVIIIQGLQAGNKIIGIKIDRIADRYMVPLIPMPLHHFRRMESLSSLHPFEVYKIRSRNCWGIGD